MNLNKIGNIICLATSLFLTAMGLAALMVLIVISPELLEQLDSMYIIPFAAGQMTATLLFILADILVLVTVIGIMSSRNRRNGFLGVAAFAVFAGSFTTLILIVFDELAKVAADPFMFIVISLIYYLGIGVSFGYLLGSVLKILHKGE